MCWTRQREITSFIERWLLHPEFRINPVNSGYYTLQIYPRVYVNMFRVKPRATLGLIFFTVLIQNSDKQWRVLSGCLEKVALGNSLGQLFPDNHCGLSTVYTRVEASHSQTLNTDRPKTQSRHFLKLLDTFII